MAATARQEHPRRPDEDAGRPGPRQLPPGMTLTGPGVITPLCSLQLPCCSLFNNLVWEWNPRKLRKPKERGMWNLERSFPQVMLLKGIIHPLPILTGVGRIRGSRMHPSTTADRYRPRGVFRHSLATENRYSLTWETTLKTKVKKKKLNYHYLNSTVFCDDTYFTGVT